ncbi:hypothetical protein KA005_02565 [bacterium]|nr:hypothetical protein [bacterium]
MSKLRGEYRIVLESNKIEKDWLALEKELPERMSECKNFLRTTPADRHRAAGRLKKLKPPYKGILQYDVTKDDVRVWYRIDKNEHTVVIKYTGHHPNW